MFKCKLKAYAFQTNGRLVFICCYVITGLCMLPKDEGAVKRPFIDPFVFVHLVCVGCRMQRMWEREWWFTLIILVQQKRIPAATGKKRQQKSNLLLVQCHSIFRKDFQSRA